MEHEHFYQPKSDAAKFALKSGALGSIVGTVVAGEQTVLLGIEAIRDLPYGETLTNLSVAVGYTILSAAMAISAPRRIDRFLDRHSD